MDTDEESSGLYLSSETKACCIKGITLCIVVGLRLPAKLLDLDPAKALARLQDPLFRKGFASVRRPIAGPLAYCAWSIGSDQIGSISSDSYLLFLALRGTRRCRAQGMLLTRMTKKQWFKRILGWKNLKFAK